MFRVFSALIAVRIKRFCKFLFLLKSELRRTISSSSSISSAGSCASMKAFTVTEASSAFVLWKISGSPVGVDADHSDAGS